MNDTSLKFQKIIELCTESFLKQFQLGLIKSAKVAYGELEDNVIAFEYDDGDYIVGIVCGNGVARYNVFNRFTKRTILGDMTSDQTEIKNFIYNLDEEKVLAGIYSDGGNIDEVAVTALGERLKSQMVDKKIMIIISDGLPHSMIGHAETRLRDLVKEYVKGGFNVFVAALGSDKAKIDKIYEDVSFIDITDPSELPTNMLRAIKRTI